MLIDQIICASRGRNPDNPSDRTAGNYVEQRLELGEKNECSHTITSVAKDNWILEIYAKSNSDRKLYKNKK